MKWKREYFYWGVSALAFLFSYFFSDSKEQGYLNFIYSIFFAIGVFIITYLSLRWRPLLYIIFIVYQVGALVFTFLVDGHLDLLGLLRYIPTFKYIALVGLILIAVDVAWFLIERRSNKKTRAELEEENMSLKTRIYDFQKSAKETSTKV